MPSTAAGIALFVFLPVIRVTVMLLAFLRDKRLSLQRDRRAGAGDYSCWPARRRASSRSFLVSTDQPISKCLEAIFMIGKVLSAGSWVRSTFARWAPIPLRLIVGYGFMQHRLCEDGPRRGLIHSHSARAGSARTTAHGMGQHTDGIAWRARGVGGCIRDICLCADCNYCCWWRSSRCICLTDSVRSS